MLQPEKLDTVDTLRAMEEMFTLFIVGKGGMWNRPLTNDKWYMSDWEECPELGTVGDILASSELNIKKRKQIRA